MSFKNRKEAGEKLAARLKSKNNWAQKNVLVLALPRGGVPIGKIVAEEIGGDLDVAITRKLRHPHNKEYAVGALSEKGDIRQSSEWSKLGSNYQEEEILRQKDEIQRRKKLYRKEKDLPSLENKTVVIVDDGVATGLTLLVTLDMLEQSSCKEIWVGLPVCSPGILRKINDKADRVEVILIPKFFMSVGQFYRDFHQVEDEEVLALLGL